MLIGLRKAWDQAMLEEQAVPYHTPGSSVLPQLFHHERLEVYQAALSFVAWLENPIARDTFPTRLFRKVDDSSTSMVLNIAESNGRYAQLDHRRFLHLAQSAVVKTAAYVDLCLAKVDEVEIAPAAGKQILERVAAMLTRMEQRSIK
jgi:hypothetical protein